MKCPQSFVCLIFSVVVFFSPAFADQADKALTSEQIFSRINSIDELSYKDRIRSPAGRLLQANVWIKGDKVKVDGGWIKTGQIGDRGFEYCVNKWVASPALSMNTVITFLKEAQKAGDAKLIGKQIENGEETTVLEYTRPRWDDFFNEMRVTLWISHETLLPVKIQETNVAENKIQTHEISDVSFEKIDEAVFEDIVKGAEEAERQAKEKWQSWQEKKEKAYLGFLKTDEDQRFTPKRKVYLWKSFLSSICKNNPYSDKDDEMRAHIRTRILYWENKASASTPKSSPSSSQNKGMERRDGTFIAYANGVVKDTATGLEWIAGPDVDINWNDAQTWVQNLRVDDGGWRMPTRDELITLYKKGAGKNNMTPLLETSGFNVWSGEKKNLSKVWQVAFFGGRTSYRVIPVNCNNCMFTRAFAVRSEHSQ